GNIGIAPGAHLVVAKVFDPTGGVNVETMIQAMEWVIDPDQDPSTPDTPHVINNSWGGSDPNSRVFWNVIENWRLAGAVPVFSSGNHAYLGHKTAVPGNYPHSFTVGAIDQNNKKTYFSQGGPSWWDDAWHIKPNIVAPGIDILSADYLGGYRELQGTSMAAPHISGLMALISQVNPDLTVDDRIRICCEAAIDLGEAGPDNKYGAGIPSAERMIEIANTPESLISSIEKIPGVMKLEHRIKSDLRNNEISQAWVTSILKRARFCNDIEFQKIADFLQEGSEPYQRIILKKMQQMRKFDRLHQ
ncbi:MAG: S8 family serine peptidase, partial [Candidatus Riflebacteria bacterium]